MLDELTFSDKAVSLITEAEKEIKDSFDEIDAMAKQNSLKVLNAFKKNHVSTNHFESTTGYGYDDLGSN